MQIYEECPCKNCISFAVCNSQINKKQPLICQLSVLIRKCEIFDDYLCNYQDPLINIRILQDEKLRAAALLFKTYRASEEPCLTVDPRFKEKCGDNNVRKGRK